ncbi:hypothetical protein HEP87_13335 [Streptomyces sp. S1D4-11]
MRYRSVRGTFAWTLVAAATLAAASPASFGPRPDCPRLAAPWYGDNRAHLRQVIDERGTCAGPIPPAGRPGATTRSVR